MTTCLLLVIPVPLFLLIARVPNISTLQEIYAKVGFTQGPAIALTSLYFKPEQYYNKESPVNKNWRNTETGIKLINLSVHVHTHTHTHSYTHTHTHTHTRTHTHASFMCIHTCTKL